MKPFRSRPDGWREISRPRAFIFHTSLAHSLRCQISISFFLTSCCRQIAIIQSKQNNSEEQKIELFVLENFCFSLFYRRQPLTAKESAVYSLDFNLTKMQPRSQGLSLPREGTLGTRLTKMAAWLRQSFANVSAVGGSILHSFHGLLPSAALPSKFMHIDDLDNYLK